MKFCFSWNSSYMFGKRKFKFNNVCFQRHRNRLHILLLFFEVKFLLKANSTSGTGGYLIPPTSSHWQLSNFSSSDSECVWRQSTNLSNVWYSNTDWEELTEVLLPAFVFKCLTNSVVLRYLCYQGVGEKVELEIIVTNMRTKIILIK